MQLDLFKQGLEIGLALGRAETKQKIKAKLESTTAIPALVRYKEVPIWWKGGKEKVDLMGTIVLVKLLEDSYFEHSWQSVRKGTNEKGVWNWNISDLILWPTKEQFDMEQARIRLSKGFK